MKEYQTRVIEEKKELDNKILALGAFIEEDPLFDGCSTPEQYRMVNQKIIMGVYSLILDERIINFK